MATQAALISFTETVDALGNKVVAVTPTMVDNLTPTGQVLAANGATNIVNGNIAITKGSAAAITLAAPTATTDDYKIITIVDTTGYLHTVTTPANKINSDSSVITFSGVVGDLVRLMAYQGIWYEISLPHHYTV